MITLPARVAREIERSVGELGAVLLEAAELERFAGDVATAERSPELVRRAAVHVAILALLRRRAAAIGALDALEAEIGETFARLAPLYRRRLEEIGRGALAA